MLRLNKLTDYAVVMLAQMAARPERRYNAADLAVDTGVPEPTVAKILKDLAKSALLDSFRGAQGGYQLAIKHDKITVRQVIEAIEGPIQMVACLDEVSFCCTSGKKCPLRGKWAPVNAAVARALDGITLLDMMRAMGGHGAGTHALVMLQA